MKLEKAKKWIEKGIDNINNGIGTLRTWKRWIF